MAKKSKTSPDSKSSGVGRVFILLLGIASFGILAYLLVEVAYQFVVPPPAHRLLFVQDIPLPSGLGPTSRGQKNPLAPGVALDFDGFDFQAYDPPTHRLFVAHTGPNPDLMTLAHTKFDPQYDGHIIVFDTQQDKIIARVNIPQVAGIVIAPDLRKAYAADAQDNIVYAIDVNTFKTTPIQLDDNESPDAISYDPVDHRIFVSDPGTPADPNKTLNADRKNENVTVIDALTDKVITKINLGRLPLLQGENVMTVANAPKVPVTQPGNIPLYGHDVGHNKYDAGLQRVFVTSQVLPNGDDPNPLLLPPPGTGELIAIAPVNVRLAGGPDIVLIDHSQHVLFVACKGGISVFDEKAGEFKKLGDYVLGKGTHTIAIDEQTQEIFLPQLSGGIPILRIGRYNPNGV